MEKICVYTCITGNYDIVNEIVNKEKGIDYYLFTNNKNITSKTWKVIYIEDESLDNQRLSRKIKMLGHPEMNDKYQIFVWMDASVIWKKSIKEFVQKYLKKNNFVTFKHAFRNCIYEEAYECIKMRKDKKQTILKHIDFLTKEGFPHDYGLCEMTVFIRRKDELVEKTMKLWFDMVCNYSKRDQLSFMYCVWKNNLKLDIIRKNVWHNEWIDHVKHNYKKELTECRIYYGDSSVNDDSYDPKMDCLYTYKKKNSIYMVNATIPGDTNIIEIEVTDVPCLVYSNFHCSLPSDKVFFYNTIPYQKKNIFYNNKGIIRLEGTFRKGEKLNFSIELEALSEIEQYGWINKLSDELIILSEEHQRTQYELYELSKIKKSIFYKMYLLKQKIIRKLKK